MKSLLQLWSSIAHECAMWCTTSATRDIKTVTSRTEHEGLSFLTITLPSFGKSFEKSLSTGIIDYTDFSSFKKLGGLPCFLRGFLSLVFDADTGVLLHNADIDAIRAIRQLTLVFGKILIDCSPERVTAAYQSYVECETDVNRWDTDGGADFGSFHHVSRLLFRDLFTDLDRKVYDHGLVPKHGPGATADKLFGNEKFAFTEWTQRMESILPCGEYTLPNWSYYDQLEAVNILEPRDERPVRVISVPKTLKTPRIIAIEPSYMMFMQQSLMCDITRGLEIDVHTNHLYEHLTDLIGFSDQTLNQRLASKGSCDGTLATLDLSDASDRVSNQLVLKMLSDHPHLSEAVQACRSYQADVPGHGIIPLAKFASMGSALTFPIEAMVFLTIVFMGIEDALNIPLTRELISKFKGQVRIYGDDIIIPTEFVDTVVARLSQFNAIVNPSKSFWTGKFRESCGKEYYDGHDVSVCRVRRMPPQRRQDAAEMVSYISTRNQLYFAGYWQTCEFMDRIFREKFKFLPVVLPTSSVVGRHSFLGYETKRLDPFTHIPQVLGYVMTGKSPISPLDGSGALLKFFLKGDLPSPDEKHLERSGRPKRVYTKLGMASAV